MPETMGKEMDVKVTAVVSLGLGEQFQGVRHALPTTTRQQHDRIVALFVTANPPNEVGVLSAAPRQKAIAKEGKKAL
jgi:hypothetical protein